MKRFSTTDTDMIMIVMLDPCGVPVTRSRLSGVSDLDGLIKALSDQMDDILADHQPPERLVDDVKPSERDGADSVNFVVDHAGRGPNGSSPVLPRFPLPDNYSDAAHHEVLRGPEVLRDVPYVRRAAPYVGTETLRFRPETVFAKRPGGDTVAPLGFQGGRFSAKGHFSEQDRPASPFNFRDPAEENSKALADRPEGVCDTSGDAYGHANWRAARDARSAVHDKAYAGIDGMRTSTPHDKLPSPRLLGGTVGTDTPPWQNPGGMGHALYHSVLDLMHRVNIDHGTALIFADDFMIHWLVKVNGPLVAAHI